MNLPRLLLIVSITLFAIIGILALFKSNSTSDHPVALPLITEIPINQNISYSPASPKETANEQIVQVEKPAVVLPDANRIEQLFSTNGTQLPIVETITYKSHVSWLKGRPAWLSDYANHYSTSRHFIARSLNGKPDYFDQDIAEGNRFNVFKTNKNFEFNLIVDTSRCCMWFYYTDLDTKEKILLKKYQVGLGRLDSSKASGLLTPLGKYSLGDRIAIYKPKVMGNYLGQKKEMITIFGTRWIPFEKEMGTCTLPAKGFGLHGTPWKADKSSELIDQAVGIGKYESDGCIRLATSDIEELFAIIITKPTTIEIVRDFTDSSFAK